MRQTKEQTIGPFSEFLKERKFQYEYSEGKTDYYTSNNFRRFLLCHVNKPLAEDSPEDIKQLRDRLDQRNNDGVNYAYDRDASYW